MTVYFNISLPSLRRLSYRSLFYVRIVIGRRVQTQEILFSRVSVRSLRSDLCIRSQINILINYGFINVYTSNLIIFVFPLVTIAINQMITTYGSLVVVHIILQF